MNKFKQMTKLNRTLTILLLCFLSVCASSSGNARENQENYNYEKARPNWNPNNNII
jgi:tryptophan-rich sensory protein